MKQLFVLLILISFVVPSMAFGQSLSVPEKAYIVNEQVKGQDKVIKDDVAKRNAVVSQEVRKDGAKNTNLIQSSIPAGKTEIKGTSVYK